MAQWVRKRFKGNKVYVWCDDDCRPLPDERGLARIRYKPDDEREYTARPAAVKELDPLPLDVEEALASFPEPPPTDEDRITIYTDGASRGNPGSAALACVLVFGRHLRDMAVFLGEASNNAAELGAVRTGLSVISRHDLPVTVFTDSTYVRGVLAGGWKAKANQELVQQCRDLMRSFKLVSIVHVEGHAGVPGNERADKLCNWALDHKQNLDRRGFIVGQSGDEP